MALKASRQNRSDCCMHVFMLSLRTTHPLKGITSLTLSSQHYLVITALGADRPGIVNTITRHVSSCGCNIEDSRLAMLGEEFTFIMLLSGSWNCNHLIESTLPLKGAELDLLIVMKRDGASASTNASICLGSGRCGRLSPHLIERFTALFDAHHMNIAELVSRTQPAENERAAVTYSDNCPQPAYLRTQQILSKRSKPHVQNSMQGGINVVNYSQHDERDGLSNESTESR